MRARAGPCLSVAMACRPPRSVRPGARAPSCTRTSSPLVLALAGLRHDARAEVALLVTDLPDDRRRGRSVGRRLAARTWWSRLVPRRRTGRSVRAARASPPACAACAAADGPPRRADLRRTPISTRAGVDAGLLALALGWAVRDLATWRRRAAARRRGRPRSPSAPTCARRSRVVAAAPALRVLVGRASLGVG